MTVHVERRDAVTIITIDRPEAANSLDRATISGLGSALTEAEHDDDVRAVVLTAAGDRVFCAGMDLRAFAAEGSPTVEGPGLEVINRRIYPKPIIGALNGHAVAGGFELAMACDLIVAAEHARFGLPEVKRGLLAAGGGTRLPKRIPLAIALEIGLTGDLIDAPRALALGLINRVVPGPKVLDEALSLASTIGANGPLALKVTKQLMYEELGEPDWDHLSEASAPVFASDDAKEGATAFTEKREPKWTGH